MNSNRLTTLLLFLCFTVFGQQKITVEEIFNGAFRAKAMDELQSLKNTNQYTVLNLDYKTGSMQIDLYDFFFHAFLLKKHNFLLFLLSNSIKFGFKYASTLIFVAQPSFKIRKY